jgi:aspartyl aminopeptidase
VKRQTLGYEEPLLLVDQLSIHLQKDANASSKLKMIDDILGDIALYVSESKLPLRDILDRFDTSGSQQMYRSDFYSTFLDT